MAPAYKLTYFGLRARGEAIRWILHYAGQEFEDHRVSFEEWGAVKATTPNGQIPVLEVDGKKLPQSVAIGRFLARRHGLAGKDAWEEAEADAVVDYVTKDATAKWIEWVKATITGQKEKAEEIKNEYVNKDVIPFLDSLEAKLVANGQGVFIGKQVTWADIYVTVFADEVLALSPTALDKYPQLKAHNARVHELKGIKEYLATRPASPF